MRRGPVLAAAVLVAACEAVVPATSPVPPQRPARVEATAPTPPARASAPAPSAESREAAALYARVERRLLAQGLLRRDGGGADTAYDAATLARNFERIALYAEYVEVDGRYVAQQAPTRLKRWPGPVRIELHFGASVDPAVRAADAARLARYADRLAAATGHPISVVEAGGNFHVHVVSTDEQRRLGPWLARSAPGLSGATVAQITTPEPAVTYCAVYVFALATDPDAYMSAVAVIPSEHPDLMRLACYHEELAQALGLDNDSPNARPSIFNDDEEFALLTGHDEKLLRILYDPRLRAGMAAAEARPIVRAIAEELVGGPS